MYDDHVDLTDPRVRRLVTAMRGTHTTGMTGSTNPGDPTVAYETITPKIAERMLAHNTRNRQLRPGRVERYADDMRRGRWQSNGATICLDADGRLVDGQHRLAAIMLAGVNVRMLVVRGVESESQKTMDQGAARSFADWLRFQGEKDTTLLASIAAADCRWNDRDKPSPARAFTNYQKDLLSRSRYADWFEAHRLELKDAKSKGMEYAKRSGGLLSRSMTGVLWLNLHRLSAPDADVFFTRLADGAGLKEDDPILALRNQLIRWKTASEVSVKPMLKAAAVIKTWNRFIQGEPAGRVTWRAGGAHREPYPVPVKP